MMIKSRPLTAWVALLSAIGIVAPSAHAKLSDFYIHSGMFSDTTGPDSYHLVPLTQPELVSLWAGAGKTGHSTKNPRLAVGRLWHPRRA